MSTWWAVWLVARREVTTRIRSRAFQISTAALVVLVAGGTAASQWLPGVFEDDPLRLGLTPITQPLGRNLLTTADAFDQELEVVPVVADADVLEAMQVYELDAVLVEPDQLVFQSSVDATLQAIVAQSAFENALPERAASLGLSLDEARSLIAPVQVATDIASPEEDDGGANGLAAITTIVLLIAMSQYGQWILVGVIEEKSNRVVEVLLAVVAPWQLLTGKVLGIMALAGIQIAVTLAALSVALLAIDGASLPEAGVAAIAMAITWLILGLLLYNFLYAAVGSTASRPEDSTSAMAPVLAPLMLGYFAALTYVPQSPDSIASRILSFFPLTAPIAMPARVNAGGASGIEVGIAVALMVVAIAGVVWAGGRIYAGAILQTHKISLITAIRRIRQG